MIASGQPLTIIAKVVGWRLSTVIEMAVRYGHFEVSALRRAVEAIAAAPMAPYEPVEGIAAGKLSRLLTN
jgi:hypothetical protein